MRTEILFFQLIVSLRCIHGRPLSCAADKYADGCSVPSMIPAPFKREFTSACNRHDICYGCGYHYNWTRQQCDEAFYKNMVLTCDHVLQRGRIKRSLLQVMTDWWREIASQQGQCHTAAKVYYEGVHWFADGHFDRKDHDYCLSKCADRHGNPAHNITFH
uniref:Uncharacterized protein n=1 Tax=Clytia hemisphaerica TaxID=252671 RepID=A0A7M5XEZ6_9CNID